SKPSLMPKLAHSLPPRTLILTWATGAMAVWGCTQSEPRSESGEGAEAPNGPASAEKESATQATAKVERTASAKSAPEQAKIAELCERSCAPAVPLNCLSKTACERQCQEAFAVPVC